MSKQLQEICNLIAELDKRNKRILELTILLEQEGTKRLNLHYKYKKLERENEHLNHKIAEQNYDIKKLYNENQELKEKLKNDWFEYCKRYD